MWAQLRDSLGSGEALQLWGRALTSPPAAGLGTISNTGMTTDGHSEQFRH